MVRLAICTPIATFVVLNRSSMSDLIQLLIRFGFEKNEAELYILLHQRGSSSAEELAMDSGMPLFSIQAAMASLVERGVVSSYQDEAQKRYSAESLEVVSRHFETELDHRTKDLEFLRQKASELESEKGAICQVKFFEGKNGIMSMLDDFLSSDEKQAYEFFPRDAIFKVFTKQERSHVIERRQKAKIFIKALYTIKPENSDEPVPHDGNQIAVRIDGEKYPMKADILVYGNKVIMASLDDELSGVLVESSAIATSLKSIFNLAFDLQKQTRAVENIDSPRP